ncbi:MAG: DUF2339 domain-containing protein, partial [Moraxellaceae bacterium]
MVFIFVGILGWLVFLQMKRMGILESTVKKLTEEHAKMQHQLAQLQNKRTEDIPQDVKATQATHVVNEPTASSPITKNSKPPIAEIESVDLELPENLVAQPIISPSNQRPIAPPTPREPNALDKIGNAVRRFFTEGNPIVNIGIVVMFFGVSFLVKYASGQGFFPIEFRLTAVILGAIALLIVGWKTRTRVGSYGLVLQGGGVAIIYLTLFAAAKIYGLIPLGIAFGLLFLVVMLGVLLALLQNTQTLAILATAGGFLAPILTSTGEGSHIGLFSFYLILNLGILAIALYKAWRLLNWVGFMFTFVITAAWGVLKYEPGFYASTQPFLIAFFALYLVVSILFSFKQPTNLKGMVDGSLVFGLPLVAFGLQTTLLKQTEHGLAISAVVLAAIYIALAIGLSRRYLPTHRVLIESFLALGISFATLAVPLALDASWTSVTWALEATGLVWIGLRQQRLRPRFVGYLLHCAAAISLLVVNGIHTGLTPMLSGDFLGLTLLAASSVVIAYLLHSFNNGLRNVEKVIAPIAVALGMIWWFVAGINEMNAHIVSEHLFAAIILFASLSALVVQIIGKKLDWALLSKAAYALLPFMLILFAVVFAVNDTDPHPTQGFSLLSITVFLLVQYRFLFNEEKSLQPKAGLLSAWHIFTAWCVFGLIFWEVFWQKNHLQLYGTAGVMIWFAAITIPVVALMGAGQKKIWPFITFERDYKNWIPAPLFLLAAFWFFSVCHKTVSNTEHYLPLLNPLDLAQFATVLMFAYAAKHKFMDAASFISN